MFTRASVVVVFLLFAASCQTMPPCDASTCASGCCAGDVCLPGTATTDCGSAGLQCARCPDGRVCRQQRCVASGASGGGAAGGSAGGAAGGSAGGAVAGGAAGGSAGGAAGGSAGGAVAGGNAGGSAGGSSAGGDAGGSAAGGVAGGSVAGGTAGGASAGGAAGGSATLQPPTGLVVAYTSNRAALEARWVNPTGAPFQRVRLLRRLDAAPTGPSDAMATLVYEGPNAIAPDVLEQLVPDMPYRGYPFGGGSKPALASRQAMRQPRIYTYAVYACSASACETTGATTTFRRNLTEALQKGGYTIFWRHASASTCSDDFGLGLASGPLIPDWWKTCRSVAMPTTCGVRATGADGGVVVITPGPFGRQLTDPAATTEITNVRTYLQTQTIPFSQALASEFCRCSETARGFFSHLSATVPVQERPELTLSVYGGRCPNINSLTTTPPAVGTNVGLVSHSGMGCSTDSLVWSQAAIFKPTLTGASCASPTVCPGADDVCVSGACWRRELIGTICDDEWSEIPPL